MVCVLLAEGAVARGAELVCAQGCGVLLNGAFASRFAQAPSGLSGGQEAGAAWRQYVFPVAAFLQLQSGATVLLAEASQNWAKFGLQIIRLNFLPSSTVL